MPMMLEDFFYLISCIILYQFQIWYQVLAMVSFQQCYIEYRMYFIPSSSSNLSVLYLIIHSTLNGPTQQVQSFSGLFFSFRCFLDNKTLSPGPKLNFLCTLLAHFLLVSAYFVSYLRIFIYNFRKLDRQSSMVGVYTIHTTISIGRCNLQPCMILLGVLPVHDCSMALMSILTRGNLSTHSPHYICMHNTYSIV